MWKLLCLGTPEVFSVEKSKMYQLLISSFWWIMSVDYPIYSGILFSCITALYLGKPTFLQPGQIL
jgi:hypothetical protein